MSKYPHPVTGKLVSRQRIKQLKAVAAGFCKNHTAVKAISGGCCPVCLKRERIRMHERQGCKRFYADKAQWASVNWDLTDDQIAEQMQVQPGYVCTKRRKLNLIAKA